jgi:hypothetical protein
MADLPTTTATLADATICDTTTPPQPNTESGDVVRTCASAAAVIAPAVIGSQTVCMVGAMWEVLAGGICVTIETELPLQ